jgi:L-cystine transport system substrate-binding protein
MRHRSILLSITTLLVGVTVLSGCGKSTQATKTTTIKVAIGNSYKPFCYTDSQGNEAGYDYEVLKAVDKLLPQYSFKYEPQGFENTLVSLGAGKAQIAAHEFTETPERAKKFLYGSQPYSYASNYLVTSKKRDDIKQLSDLAGKTLHASSGGDAAATQAAAYNKAHSPKIKLVYSDTSREQLINNLINGTYAATYQTKYDVQTENKEYGDKLKTNGKPLDDGSIKFLFTKKETKLAKAVDGAVKKLRKNGQLKKISQKTLGGDYTTE